MKQGRQQSTKEEQHRHFDSVAYWREQYERAEARCRQLEQRNVQLERANDDLQKMQLPVSVPEASKRKAESRKQGGSAKRLKSLPKKPEDSVMGAQVTFAGDLDILGGIGEGRSPFELHS